MFIQEMTPIPPNSNPFDHDAYHMGTTLGTNCLIMHENHTTKECKYLIIINKVTGERVRIAFEEKDMVPSLANALVNAAHGKGL